jgi:DNA-binding NtrC family response regulator
MELQRLNLFIVDENISSSNDLKQYLSKRFGLDLTIYTFTDGDSCLKKVDESTHIVLLDLAQKDKNGLEVLKSIKIINPKTEVIMLASHENVAQAIDTFRAGASGFVIKGQGYLKKISTLIQHIFTEPIRILVREFGISKYMATFLLIFVTMGLAVYGLVHLLK